MDKLFHRKNKKSNTCVGRILEENIKDFFIQQGLLLNLKIPVKIGFRKKRLHNFDLGNLETKIIIECKAHTWTESGNVPSAKLSIWNEAMYYFYVAPPSYRKILVVLRSFSDKKKVTLGAYYIRTYSHLIPKNVEIWEYDLNIKDCKKIN